MSFIRSDNLRRWAPKTTVKTRADRAQAGIATGSAGIMPM
jgi:hypothetical protein